MDAQELRNLQEAYMEVVENKQQLDEALTGERYKKVMKKPGGTAYSRKVSADPAKRATRGGRGGESDFGAGDRGRGNRATRRSGGDVEDTRYDEQVDIYDIILSHLLDEGYAETQEQAEVIMVNMSEDWRESIIEADSIAAMRERAAKRRKQRYGASDTSRGGRDDFAPIKDYAAANKKWDRPHAQKESFNIFVNSMIAEGVSMEQYTWEEIQNVFDDLFEAQVANRNPDEYERKEKKGQSREQQLKGRVMGRMSQMDPDKKAAMLKQMRAVGLDV